MRSSKSIAVVAIALLAALPAVASAEDTSADEAFIRASAPAWADAFNAGDAEAMAAMYWDDALLMPPNEPSATGHEGIRDSLAAGAAFVRDAGWTMNIPEAGKIDIAGHLAYEQGDYTVTDAEGNVIDKGKYLGVFEKRDGVWKYIRDTWNSDLLPPPAE